MSRLDELIRELCPDGVECKPLRTVATISRGGNLQKKDFCESGVPCIHYGQIYTRYGFSATESFTFISPQIASKQKFAVKGDIIMAVTSENVEDVCKCVVWLGDEDVAVSGHTAIIHHNVDPKYLAYFFQTESFSAQKRKLVHGTKVMEVTPDSLYDLIVPLPPLPVQREIVRILDNFAELTAELAAELLARKKQYEYYRDMLLTFTENRGGGLIRSNIKWMTLIEACDYVDYRGKTPRKTDNGIFLVTAKNIKRGYIDYSVSKEYIAKETYNEVMRRGVPQIGDLLITTEAPCGNIALVDHVDIALAQRVIKYRPKNGNLLSSFMKHYMLGKEFQTRLLAQSTGGTVQGIKGSKLHQMQIPIPPIEEQQRIVSILDRFDALCNDLTSGLPAEIEARRKQYEYYRDKLLTFRPLS